ncbi:hypothetical protein RJZ56_000362 [Blastomyces dermatitidis]|uniref:Uncharacterized protein n=1 Tax=Ajellomyces dermatitidis (strain ER-3 / ATCC MYA-2586) TaxID=559297 RepID=A0ABP2EWZ6_AJEDR|nr:uncharacterized protein BDCG_03742 [Blastomyces dermatitidis ER-3]EEQ88622.2 hypothetical protein BDCG_03742 [Blastomyces dermatitidis ER-3]EQL38719.1 hypothetical protein BDFG_00266 [Blastomyces dermatitidis ATCC 26199]
MGRQPYMNLLALGRSPYEAPETPPQGYVAAEPRAEDSINADGYVQEYDARGHPINPDSKALARQLRRAKNDILSTMGIVVSGEDGSLGISKERQRMNLLSSENDYGLAMATVDQVVMFFSSWWTTSLAARIQTFKRYTHVPFLQIIRLERHKVGLFGFYAAGIPAWTVSFIVSVCRNHFLEPALDYIHGKVSSLFDNDVYKSAIWHTFKGLQLSCKLGLFVVLGQTYMFSLLQSLHILPALAVPTLRSLLPFGPASLIQLPPLPARLSVADIGNFSFGLLTAPFTVLYMYVYLRPVIESRIYRILRRKLPKPDRPDSLSLRVAAENDLIEWTVPSLGRRSDEEYHRGDLTISEELKYELRIFKNWILGIFGLKIEESSDARARPRSTSHSLQSRLEQLSRDFDTSMAPFREETSQPDETLVSSIQARGEQLLSGHVEGARPRSPTPDATPQEEFGTNQILSGDEQRMSQSPLQLTDAYFDQDDPSQGRPGMEETFRMDHSTSPHRSQSQGPEESHRHHFHSRSNTLFSHPSTPESSPLASPRVRASLVHQNSDVITMQLELLRSNHNSPSHTRTNYDNDSLAGPDLQAGITLSEAERATARILDEVLLGHGAAQADALHLANQPSDQNATLQPGHVAALEELTDISNHTNLENNEQALSARPTTTTATHESPTLLQPLIDVPESSSAPTLAEPATTTTINDENRRLSQPLPTQLPRRSRSDRLLGPDHRVTILSSLPVDSLSSHLASLLTSVLFYPLESMYLRNFAIQFLTSPSLLAALPLTAGASTALTLGLSGDVRSICAWCGGGSRKDMIAYLAKMGLVVGTEALVSVAVWGMGTAATVMLGTRKFGWGEL